MGLLERVVTFLARSRVGLAFAVGLQGRRLALVLTAAAHRGSVAGVTVVVLGIRAAKPAGSALAVVAGGRHNGLAGSSGAGRPGGAGGLARLAAEHARATVDALGFRSGARCRANALASNTDHGCALAWVSVVGGGVGAASHARGARPICSRRPGGRNANTGRASAPRGARLAAGDGLERAGLAGLADTVRRCSRCLGLVPALAARRAHKSTDISAFDGRECGARVARGALAIGDLGAGRGQALAHRALLPRRACVQAGRGRERAGATRLAGAIGASRGVGRGARAGDARGADRLALGRAVDLRERGAHVARGALAVGDLGAGRGHALAHWARAPCRALAEAG